MMKQNNSVDELYSLLGIDNSGKEIRNTLNLGSLNKNINANKPSTMNCDHRQMWSNSISLTK